jgi:fucose permease
MVCVGIVLTTLGATLPLMSDRFAIDAEVAGALLALVSFGFLVGSLTFGPIVDRNGYKALLAWSFAASAVALAIVAFAPSLLLLRLSLLVLGVAGGMVNGGVNALTADVSGEQRSAALTFVGAFFGVGAAGVPLLLYGLSNSVRYQAILAASGLYVLLPLALCVRTRFPESKQPHGFPVHDARRLLGSSLLLLIGVILFLESGIETITGGFITTFVVQNFGVSAERAPIFLSAYWLGLLLCRLVLSRLLRTVRPPRLVLASIVVALAGVWLVLSVHDRALGGIGAFVLGCGFASTFPVMFGVIGERFAHLSGTALGLAMTMALSGGMVLPYVTGLIADARGMRAGFMVVPAALVVLGTMIALLVNRLWPAFRTSPRANVST